MAGTAAAAAVLQPDVSLEAEAEFVAWMREKGAVAPKLQYPAYDAAGLRGAVATEDIAAGETLLRIPASLMINLPVCLHDKDIGHVLHAEQAMFDGNTDAVLATYLAWHKTQGAASKWHVYMRVLPQLETLADWCDAELEELGDAALAAVTRARQQFLAHTSGMIVDRLCSTYPALFDARTFTRELLIWATKTVCARAFGRRLHYASLMPLADCFNHNNVETKYKYEEPPRPRDQPAAIAVTTGAPTTAGTLVGALGTLEVAVTPQAAQQCNDDDGPLMAGLPFDADMSSSSEEEVEQLGGGFLACRITKPRGATEQAMTAEGAPAVIAHAGKRAWLPDPPNPAGTFSIFLAGKTSYRAGEQVCISYGRRTNAHLALEYGFVLDDNQWETVVLQPGGPNDSGTVPIVSPAVADVLARSGPACGPVTLRWSAFAEGLLPYFRVVTLTDEEVARWRTGAIPSFRRPVSSTSECAAIAAAVTYLHSVLDSMAPSIADDEAALARLPGGRLQLAIQYRLTRKRIIAQQIAWLEAAQTVAKLCVARNAAMERAGPTEPAQLEDHIGRYLAAVADTGAAELQRRIGRAKK